MLSNTVPCAVEPATSVDVFSAIEIVELGAVGVED
jgi:hypothetical protein